MYHSEAYLDHNSAKEVKRAQEKKHARAIQKERLRHRKTFTLLIVALAMCIALAIYAGVSGYMNEKKIAQQNELIAEYESERDNIASQYESQLNSYQEQIAYLKQLENVTPDRLKILNEYSYVLDHGLSSDLVLYMDSQCQRWNINPHLMWAIIETESRYNPSVDNTEGSSARGLGQIVIATARHLWEDVLENGKGTYMHSMAYDPYINIQMACALIGTGLENGDLQYTIDRYSGKTEGYLEHIIGVANSHNQVINDQTCRYPKTDNDS